MILVTGATGTVGSRVLSLLLDRGAPVRAMTRNPATIPPAPGLEVVGTYAAWARQNAKAFR